MNQHSDTVQPKKIAITVGLLALLFVFAWYFSKEKNKDTQKSDQATASTQINLNNQN